MRPHAGHRDGVAVAAVPSYTRDPGRPPRAAERNSRRTTALRPSAALGVLTGADRRRPRRRNFGGQLCGQLPGQQPVAADQDHGTGTGPNCPASVGTARHRPTRELPGDLHIQPRRASAVTVRHALCRTCFACLVFCLVWLFFLAFRVVRERGRPAHTGHYEPVSLGLSCRWYMSVMVPCGSSLCRIASVIVLS